MMEPVGILILFVLLFTAGTLFALVLIMLLWTIQDHRR